ncbi:hypothetical protein ACK2M7_09750 [Chryseobacterium sp. TY4]
MKKILAFRFFVFSLLYKAQYIAPKQAFKNGKMYEGNQNIHMPKIAAMMWSHQKDLIIVDRALGGTF